MTTISIQISLAELLLAAEDNFPAYNAPGQTAANGDELSNSKETFFIKLANVRVKNIWKGTDLVLGEQSTPSFAMLIRKSLELSFHRKDDFRYPPNALL